MTPGATFAIHFDSVNPYTGQKFSWGTLNPLALVQHVVDDVVYGSICNCVLPH